MSMLPDGQSRDANRYVDTKRVAFAWTREREEVVRARWMEGWSASQIAHEIGAHSRNVVIGKLHRLGLTGNPQRTALSRLARPAKPRPAPKRALGAADIDRGATQRLKKATAARNRPRPGGADGGLLYRIRNDADGPALTQFAAHPDEPASLDLPIEKWTERTCKWIHGDGAPHLACGHTTHGASPYCQHHDMHSRATNPGRWIRDATDLNAPGARLFGRTNAVMSAEAEEATAS